MQAGADRDIQQFVPGRMKLDLINAMTEAVERLEVRRIAVGGKAERDRFGLAELAAEHAKLALRPHRAFARHRLAQHRIATE
jgi:hypothetical protein